MVVYVVIMLFDEYSMKIDIKKTFWHMFCVYMWSFEKVGQWRSNVGQGQGHLL